MWLRIRPSTDGALALGIINVIIQEELYDREFVEKWGYGFKELAERAAEYNLRRVSEITWVPVKDIIRAARMMAENTPMSLEWGCAFEAVLRYLSPKLGFDSYSWTRESGVRGFEGIKRISLDVNGSTVRIAVVSGLKNAEELLRRVESGEEKFELIEVMACPGGCIMGGGQPADSYLSLRRRHSRSGALYGTDEAGAVKASQENAPLAEYWDKFIAGHEHELLHRNFE